MSYQVLCRRTEYPKLGYICHRLNEAEIDWKFETNEDGSFAKTFHADRILLVREDHVDKAWAILMEKWNKTRGVKSMNGKTTLDDMPDDHPAFVDFDSRRKVTLSIRRGT